MIPRFAFVLALLAALSCRGHRPAAPPSATRNLISLFGEAEVRSDALDLPYLAPLRGPGWAEAGPPGAPVLWTRRASAELHMPFFSTADKELALRVRCQGSLGPRAEVSLALNGHPLGTLRVTSAEQEFRLAMPASAQVAGDNTLVLSLPGRGQPAKGRWRSSGVALIALRVRPLGSTNTAAVPSLEDGRIRLPAGSSVAYYLREEGQATLELEAEAGAAAPTRLAVALQSDRERVPVGEVVMNARGTGRLRARLAAAPGAFVRLELANPGRGSLYLRAPRIEVPLQRAPVAGRPLPNRPNIVIFLVDTLRPDYLGAYGHKAPTSPRFDAFAREAIVFDDARAQAPWTRSAVASIFTGLHVGTHGVDRVDRKLSDRFETLARRLKAAGYRTGGVFASYVVRGAFGFGQGFDYWNTGEDLSWSPAGKITDRALRWLDSASGPGPFFLYVHTLDPHSPYEPEQENWTPFSFDYRGERDTKTLLAAGARRGRLPPDELRFLESRYEGEVLQDDKAFGALIDGLRDRRVLDDSIMIFISDHGEEFLEHHGTEHARTLYEELIHIPLAVRLPGGIRGGRRESYTVQQIDLMPTLLALADVPGPTGLEGRDLSAFWLGEARPEEIPPLLISEARFELWDKLSVRSGSLTLIRNYDNPVTWRAGVDLELYDLSSDPAQKRNLVGPRPIAARYLDNRLRALRSLLERRQENRDERASLTREDREQLRALGYIQ